MAALIASLVSPLVVLYFDHGAEAELFVALAILLWFKHRPNIERLLAGTEGRIGAKT
jgi:glycerol-3-phosphate acyltransferase PlsY